MSAVDIIEVPYDSGHRGRRMGAGPGHLLASGLPDALRRDGHDVDIEAVESGAEFRTEIGTQFELYRDVAARVAAAREANRFPLILSGNCGATIGAVAGNGRPNLGVVWFDAHGDFNTPETSPSGYLDGMALAVIAGMCWRPIASSIEGFTPLAPRNLIHAGGSDFDPGESELLAQHGVPVVDLVRIRSEGVIAAFTDAVAELSGRCSEVHLHIDLDVLDPAAAPANGYVRDSGGLSVAELEESITLLRTRLKVTSATVAAFDPSFDPERKTTASAVRLIRQLVRN